MNNTVSVQVLAAEDDLPQIVAGLRLGECFPPLVQLQERLGEGRKEERAVGTQAQGREAVSLGESCLGPYPAVLLQDSYALHSPLSQATTVQSALSPTSSLTWDSSLNPSASSRVPRMPPRQPPPRQASSAARDPFSDPSPPRKPPNLAPTTLCLTQPHSGRSRAHRT